MGGNKEHRLSDKRNSKDKDTKERNNTKCCKDTRISCNIEKFLQDFWWIFLCYILLALKRFLNYQHLYSFFTCTISCLNFYLLHEFLIKISKINTQVYFKGIFYVDAGLHRYWYDLPVFDIPTILHSAVHPVPSASVFTKLTVCLICFFE